QPARDEARHRRPGPGVVDVRPVQGRREDPRVPRLGPRDRRGLEGGPVPRRCRGRERVASRPEVPAAGARSMTARSIPFLGLLALATGGASEGGAPPRRLIYN